MKMIEHPDEFKDGIRVHLLCGRHKDGVQEQRNIIRISRNAGEFDNNLELLAAISRPNERIYASAAPRSLRKASRRFRQMQLDSEYDADPTLFYYHIEARWASALMDPKSVEREDKLWLVDIDDSKDRGHAKDIMHVWKRAYETKNGWHLLIHPMDKTKMPETIRKNLDVNPLMLWGY